MEVPLMDLSKDARLLLNSARRADAAPRAARQRVRQRFLDAVAVGTIGTAAAGAKGATMTALGIATHVGAGVSAGTSLAASLVGAVATGLALGMVAITPAGRVTDAPLAGASAATADAARATVKAPLNRWALSTPIASNGQSALPTPPSAMSVLRGAQSPLLPSAARMADARANRQPGPSAASSGSSVETFVPLGLDRDAPPLGSVGILRASKASIARETELLAGVQRALQQRRPATALSILNRYTAEFPSGELHEESIASRVVALCDFGRRDDAERWRAEFFRRYPNSPLSARVRAACEAAAPMGSNHSGTPK
jgi:hypothetical protein